MIVGHVIDDFEFVELIVEIHQIREQRTKLGGADKAVSRRICGFVSADKCRPAVELRKQLKNALFDLF